MNSPPDGFLDSGELDLSCDHRGLRKEIVGPSYGYSRLDVSPWSRRDRRDHCLLVTETLITLPREGTSE